MSTIENTLQELEKVIHDVLKSKGLRFVGLTEEIQRNRTNEIINFTNAVIKEYKAEYCWNEINEEYLSKYFLDKFSFSFLIEEIQTKKIAFLNISSNYNNSIHYHCTYVGAEYRNLGLAKLHMLYMVVLAKRKGLSTFEGYWPKKNNGSICLHLKMGWSIEDLRKNGTQLFLVGNTENIYSKTIELLKF